MARPQASSKNTANCVKDMDEERTDVHFPNSVDYVLGWSSLKPETRQKLLWYNAARFYKQT
jgi:hypothetical protein